MKPSAVRSPLSAFVLCAAIVVMSSFSSAATPVVAALLPGQPPAASTPPAAPRPQSTDEHSFSLAILSVDPATPVVGRPITIAYVVKNLGPGSVPAHVSATIAGGFPQTDGGRPPVDTVYLGQSSRSGTLAITGGAAGANLIVLTLSHAPCGAAAAASPACAPTIFARATTTVALAAPPAAPTTRVRIAGTTYAQIHSGDARDGTIVASGYSFVVHDPDCSSNFASGKNGDDVWFKKKDLPAGAKLRAVDFSMYRVPPGLKTQYYAGGTGGYGSYGLKLEHDSGDALHVHWENACRGPYRTLPVVYSISFEIEVPSGVDLGEDATAATQQPTPPTSVNYTTLGVVSGSTNAAAATLPAPEILTLEWNGEAYSAAFAPPVAGTVGAIQNDRNTYPIVLIADKRLGDGCAPSGGNVLLAPRQTTTEEQLTALYGPRPVRTPKTVTACATSPLASPSQPPIVTLTFQPD